MRSLRTIAAVALAGGLSAGVATACGGPSNSPSPAQATHVITDSTGATVQVPTTINRIADSWPAHNEVLQLLGAGDKIVATVLTPKTTPWLYTIDPALNNAQTVFTSTTVTTEKLTAARPDVVFVSNNSQLAAKTTELGIPTLQLIFQNFDDLKKVVTTTADVLGPDAQAQATAYNSYLDTTLASVSAKTATVPTASRPKVLHISTLDPLVIDGTDSIIDSWITAAGGRNAASVSGTLKPVSTEQIAQWNPDVIILGTNAGGSAGAGAETLAKLAADPFFGQLAAVRNHRTYINPAGAYLWDRYSAEEALQVQWAAKLLHPELFTDLDMVAATKSFYTRFLHYDLTDEQAGRILAAQNPA
jgi:iron complex transport system substrate-binding protein